MSDTNIANSIASTVSKTGQTKKRKQKQKNSRSDDLIEKAINLLESKHQQPNKREEDAQASFARHVAHQLRSMETDAMREYAKLQIQQILVNIRFGGQQHQQQQQRQQQNQSIMHHSNTGFLQSLGNNTVNNSIKCLTLCFSSLMLFYQVSERTCYYV